MKILITGFDAFNKDTYNPSYEAIKTLDDNIAGAQIIKVQLETKFIETQKQISELMKEYNPDYVILTGQAAGRDKISLEKIALNVMDSSINDNAKFKPSDQTIVEDSDYALVSSIDLKKLKSYLDLDNISSHVSYHAGTFVCNSTYYKVLNEIKNKYKNTKALFVHVPIIKEQASNYKENTPTMTLEEISTAFDRILTHIASNKL